MWGQPPPAVRRAQPGQRATTNRREECGASCIKTGSEKTEPSNQICRSDEQMKTLTVTAARMRFGALLDAVQQKPVLILRKNRDASVIMSAAEYTRIRGLESSALKGAIFPRRTNRSGK